MTAEATELRLGLAARAENLALVRQALAGFADAISMGDGTLADLKQIATEACMNAVVHAYPAVGEEGRIDVTAIANEGTVELRVRDWGVGFRPRPAEPDGSLRLGLPLIATVADSFEIASPADGGTAARPSGLIDPLPIAMMKRQGMTVAQSAAAMVSAETVGSR